jgi:hypothetical protein
VRGILKYRTKTRGARRWALESEQFASSSEVRCSQEGQEKEPNLELDVMTKALGSKHLSHDQNICSQSRAHSKAGDIPDGTASTTPWWLAKRKETAQSQSREACWGHSRWPSLFYKTAMIFGHGGLFLYS